MNSGDIHNMVTISEGNNLYTGTHVPRRHRYTIHIISKLLLPGQLLKATPLFNHSTTQPLHPTYDDRLVLYQLV